VFIVRLQLDGPPGRSGVPPYEVDPQPVPLRVHETRGQVVLSEFVKKLAQVFELGIVVAVAE
jgi:hypothetical protein